jgi:adenylate cyclase
LANAHRLNGEDATALATVEEAIRVATERHSRIPECLAYIVRADLLLRSPTGNREAEGRQDLERARALMQETGAKLFENFINEIDAEPGRARQMPARASREDRMA